MKTIQKIFFVLLLTTFSSVYGECNPGDYKDCKQKSERGDVDAQYNLGDMFYLGMGVPQHFKEAQKWYRKAAEQGHAEAQYNLGVMYAKGEGVSQDFNEASKWYRKSKGKDIVFKQSESRKKVTNSPSYTSQRKKESDAPIGLIAGSLFILLLVFLFSTRKKETEYYDEEYIEEIGEDGSSVSERGEGNDWESYVEFYDNEQKKEEGSIKNGKAEGLWVEWYENGNMKSEGDYLNGEIDGTWSYWDEDGSVSKVRRYKNGELIV